MHRYYYPIDALRFASALGVVFFHLSFYCWASDSSSTAHAFNHVARFELLAPWTWFGWVGVEVFFVISGFVITNSANGATPMAFVRGRVSRLYPAVPACAAISLIALVWIVGDPVGGLVMPFLKSALLVPLDPWIDGVYWSLAVEIVFYCVIFFMLVIGKFGAIRKLAWTLTLWSGAFLIATFYVQNHAELAGEWWSFLAWESEILLLRHGCFFAVGTWLWLASSRLLSFSGAVGLLLAIAASCGEIVLRAQDEPGLGGAHHSPLLPVALWLAAVALIFWAGRSASQWTPRSERVRRGLRRFGAMTYPLYLVHNVAGAAFSRLLIGLGITPLLALLCAISGMVVLSYVICRFWEPMARRSLQHWLQDAENIIRSRAKPLKFLFVPGGMVGQLRNADAGPLRV